jgi:hypothetical protein
MNERFVHPLMKALLWALYLPQYPEMSVEIYIDDKYKPDVVAFDPAPPVYRVREPVFWGEAGRVGRDKIESLARRYPDTHFAIGKWDTSLRPHSAIIEQALDDTTRRAPFDLISFPDHSAEFIDDDGQIHISFADLDWRRFEGE